MSFKATALFLLTVSSLLAIVKSAPASHSLNVRQYSSQNITNNSTNTPSTLTNTNASDFVKQNGLAAQKLNSEFAAINVADPCQGSFYSALVYLSSHLNVCQMARWLALILHSHNAKRVNGVCHRALLRTLVVMPYPEMTSQGSALCAIL